jgi:hypothetical protein
VDVEIVLDQGDGLSFGEVDIGQLFQDVSIIYGGVAIRDFDMAPGFERSKHQTASAAITAFTMGSDKISRTVGS